MSEEQLSEILAENDENVVSDVCNILAGHGNLIISSLADFVASMCHVDKDAMFANNTTLVVSQARWLFWYAYRYMTNETYCKIGKETGALYGREFTQFGVSSGVGKMSVLIEKEPIWRKRWSIIKRIIKEYNGEEKPEPVKVFVPKNVNVEVIKE